MFTLRKRLSSGIIAAIAIAFAGCGTLTLNPVADETHTVRMVMDSAKTVTVPEGMVWYDMAPPSRGLRFPPGTYTLEAEDADYWYLRSAAPLEFRTFRNGEVSDARSIPGGIMIGKTWLRMVPAGGYIDGDGATKIMTWKLGKDFLKREGRDWKKSF